MGELFGFLAIFVFGMFLGANSSFVKVTPDDWHEAEELCSNNESIDRFVAKPLADNAVVCKNTARFILKDEKK